MRPLYRIVYRVYRIFSWLRFRLARRLTPAGLIVSVGFVVVAMLAVDTENTIAYQAFTLLLFLLLTSWICGWRFRARFAATRALPRFGTAGQPFSYTISIRNLSRKTQTNLTLLENLGDPRPSFEEWMAYQKAEEKRIRSLRLSLRLRSHPFKPAVVHGVALRAMRPNEEIETRIELTPLRRGVIRFAGVICARTDPFGLIRAMSRTPVPQTVLVLPRRYPLPALAFPGVLKYQEGGVALASSVGRSEEFVALREYRRGDPLRHIHWRSWAKTGRPIVKEFEDEFFVRHALVLDTFIEHPYSEAFEEAVSVAASFACTIQTQESLLDLLFVGPQAYCFTAGRGLAHADQMLEILASVRPAAGKPFHDLEHLVLNHIRAVSGCICVLLAWDAERRAFIEKLERLGVPLLVLVVAEVGQGNSIEAGPCGERVPFHVLEAGRIEECLAAAVKKLSA